MAKPKITIDNGTNWTTASLRRLVRSVMDAVGVRHAKVIDVEPRRQGGVSCPRYGSRSCEAEAITLRIPDPTDVVIADGDDVRVTRSAARLLFWGMMTCQGVRNRDMTDDQRHLQQNVDHIIDGKTLQAKPPKKQPPPKPAPEPAPVPLPPPKETPAERGARLRDARASHAASMLAKARKRIRKLEADMKRAQTVEARWLAKVRYYQRTQAGAFTEADRIIDELDDIDDALAGAVDELKGTD